MKKSSGFLLRLMVIVAFFLCSQSIVFATGKQESGSSAARGSDFLTKYSGTTLRIVSWATAYSDVAQRINPEFEKITGIKVNWEMYGAWQAREKFGIELAAHSQDLDLFWYQNTASSLWLYKGGHLEDIRKYINDPARTPRDWDWKDFYPGIVKSLEIFPDMPLSMPTGAVSDMLYYRKDLLEKKGIAVPKTYAELEQAAAKLAEDTNGDGKIDVYGWVCRGKGGQATYPLANPLYAFGGAWFTKDGQPAINKPESLEAIEWYGRMMRKYGPPAPLGLDWLEAAAVFESGKAALFMADSDFNVRFLDPKTSQIVGKWDAAIIPRGPKGNHQNINISLLGMSKYSRNKDAAWHYLQWINNKENIFKILQAGFPVARSSAWENPAFNVSLVHEGWAKVMRYAFKNGVDHSKPFVFGVEEVRAEVGKIIEAAILGQDIKPIADKAAEAIKEICRKDGSDKIPVSERDAYKGAY